MKRSDWVGSVVGRAELDPTHWPRVRTDSLPKDKRARFKRRERALSLYFKGELAIAEILTKTGLSKAELYRVRDRATTVRDDGQVWGYLACIPGFHIKPYELKPETTNGPAGTVGRFFSQHPDLGDLVTAWALGRKSPDVGPVRGRQAARIWAGFEKACAAQDIPMSAAPSREAIRRLCVRIRRKHFKISSRLVNGKDAADIASTGLGDSEKDRAHTPYQRVQLDGHRLDGIITLEIVDGDGTTRDLPLERLWLLVLIDEASRAILGYHISLCANYTADDVLECVAHALTPWSAMETPSTKIAYRAGAGLPSGVIDGCAWRAFDALALDNAMAHTSVWVQERIIGTAGPVINTGRPARALSRAIVERFFRTFEDESLHRWPSTVGSGPKDARRHKPDQAAQALKISLDDLHLITDITIANYNAAGHKALNGRSPLDYIRYYDEHGLTLPRHLPEVISTRLPLYDREFERTIAGDAKCGRRPYVTFMGARYRNEALALLIDRIGEKITLIVNVRDIRRVEAQLADGTSIGTLSADESWLRQPHSLRTRRSIMKLMKAGELSRETHNPVGDHLRYLKQRAALTRRDRNRLLQHAREAAAASPSDIDEPGQGSPPGPKQPLHPLGGGRQRIRVTDVFTK